MPQITTDYDDRPWIHYQAALKVARILATNHFDAYLIGGAVRDIWLGRVPKDFDLVTDATPNQILGLADLVAAHYADPAQAFGVSRVKVEVKIRGQTFQSTVEVATYRRDIEAHLGRKETKVEFSTLEDDVQRRDFTINALALDLANDYLVDYVDGIADLNAKLVRFIGPAMVRIKEDPLRILRAIRIKNELGFDYTRDTKLAIHTSVANQVLEIIPKERLLDELNRILVGPGRVEALKDMLDLGLIDHLLPEVARLKGTPQQPQYHSEGDVWTHTLLALGYLPTDPSRRLTWATLLHDIGKPVTLVPSGDATQVEFPSHYEVGAQMVSAIAGRLGFPKQLANDATWMVRYHMGIDDLPKMRPSHRQAFMANPAFHDLIALHKADARASRHLGPDGVVDNRPPSFPLLDQLAREHTRLTSKPLPSLKNDLGIDGKLVMQQLAIPPGPRLGEIVNQLNEAYLDGEIKTREQAISLAIQLAKTDPK